MKHIGLWSLVLVFILSACGRAPVPQSEPTLETQATITVNTTTDELDLFPNSTCSLREAIVSANENRDVGGCSHRGNYGTETINLPAGTFDIFRMALICSQDQDCHDLDITSSLVLDGAGSGSTIIRSLANTLPLEEGRAFEVGKEGTSISVTLRDLKITGGKADYGGGLFHHTQSTTRLENVIIEDNESTEEGGGIYSTSAGTLTLVNSVIRSNNTQGKGGGIHNAGQLVIEKSTVSANQAVRGGGIYNFSDATLTNVTISGNQASDRGGAIRSDGGDINLLNVTIASNTAGSRQGGIARAAGDFILGNTIIAGNSAPSHPDCEGSFGSTGNNLIGIVSSGCTGFSSLLNDIRGSTNSPRNPQLGPLTDNGGPTQTHALLPGSPALDVGNPSLCPTTDQRNVTRPFDGNNDGFPICDIGALEYNTPFSADLRISLDDQPSSVVTSASFNYLMTVNNLGPDRAALARAVLTVPSSVTVLSTPSGCSTSGNVVTCSLGNLNSGASASKTITVRAPTTVPSAGYVIGIATAGSSTLDPTPTNRSIEATIITNLADLTIDLSSSASTVLTGSSFDYNLVMGNLGPNTAQNVTATLNLPSGLTIDSLDGCTQPSLQVVSCNLSSLGAGTTVTKTIAVNAASSAGTLSASATISATSPTDPESSNNSDSVTVTVSFPATDMNIAIPSPTQNSNAPRNTDMTYQVRVRNIIGTPAIAENVVLTVTFPKTVSNIQVPAGCTLNSFVVICNIGIVSAGAIVPKDITVRLPNAATSVAVNASITLSNPDPNTTNNQLTRTINTQ